MKLSSVQFVERITLRMNLSKYHQMLSVEPNKINPNLKNEYVKELFYENDFITIVDKKDYVNLIPISNVKVMVRDLSENPVTDKQAIVDEIIKEQKEHNAAKKK